MLPTTRLAVSACVGRPALCAGRAACALRRSLSRRQNRDICALETVSRRPFGSINCGVFFFNYASTSSFLLGKPDIIRLPGYFDINLYIVELHTSLIPSAIHNPTSNNKTLQNFPQ